MAEVLVVTNLGGELLYQTVRERLKNLPVEVKSVKQTDAGGVAMSELRRAVCVCNVPWVFCMVHKKTWDGLDG